MKSIVSIGSSYPHNLTAVLLQWQSEHLEAVSYIREGRGLMEEEVVVDFSPDRFRMLETEDSRKMIEMRWKEATAGNARLFNASKYRQSGALLEVRHSDDTSFVIPERQSSRNPYAPKSIFCVLLCLYNRTPLNMP